MTRPINAMYFVAAAFALGASTLGGCSAMQEAKAIKAAQDTCAVVDSATRPPALPPTATADADAAP